MTEHQLHVSVCHYLNLVLPKDCWWSSIPAGEGGGRIRGALWKSRGAVAGLPDLIILCRGRAHFIELKNEKGRLSEAQTACHEAILRADGRVATCRSIPGIRAALDIWGITTREAV